MSVKHPVIAITGSSGAGTTVRDQDLRAHLPARADRRRRRRGRRLPPLRPRRDARRPWRRRRGTGTPTSATSAPRRTSSRSSRRSSARTARPARASSASTSTTRPRRRRSGSRAGTFTPWRSIPEGTDLLFYEGLHGGDRHGASGRRAPRRPARGRRPHREPGVDPEDPPRQGRARLLHRGGGGHDPAPHAGLRELHLPAVLAHAHQLPARPHRRHLEPLHRARHPHRGRELRRDPLPRSEGDRLPVPASRCSTTPSCPARTPSSCRAGRWSSRCRSSSRPRSSSSWTGSAGPRSAPRTSRMEKPMRADLERLETSPRIVPPRVLADAIRMLAADAVQRAGSGHPGMPMGMADIAEVLWSRFLRHAPETPLWPNRDRVVVSNGHGSMLLYAMLHLTGYDLGVEELRRFRQLGSRTPGHPERGVTPGVETTTGPLGQGLANAVGMALAEKLLAAEFNRPGHEVVDHHTYVLLGDGCLMEGLSHEAASLAGALGLGKLVCLYDDNGISIDGRVEGWFRDDTRRRFEAYGWHVVAPVDGHDREAVVRGDRGRARCDRSTEPRLLPDHHRQGLSREGRQPRGPRRAARRRRARGDPGRARLAAPAVPDPLRDLRRLRRASARRGARGAVGRPHARLRARAPGPRGGAAPEARRRPAPRCRRAAPAGDGGRERAGKRTSPRAGRASSPSRRSRARCRSSSAAPRT